MSSYFDEDFDPFSMTETQAIDINEILTEGSFRERQRIIKLLENKLNSIPYKIGAKSDKLIIKKTIKEIIAILEKEFDKDYEQTA